MITIAIIEDDEDTEGTQQVSPITITDKNPQVSPTTNNIIAKNISISPRCIGCGKCVRMDREHFQMVGELSTVTSQDNLDSQNLQMAIAICPVNAISIN